MLSIIIPTLDEEDYLPSLLESIKKQNLADYEIIIADAGSEDKTREIAREYGCKVASGGLPAKGRNQGAALAQGDLLLFLDAETVLPEGFFGNVLSEFERRNLAVAGCGLAPLTRHKIPKILYDLLYNWPIRFLENVFPYASSLILVRREIYQRVGGFDESIKIAEDHAFARKAAGIGRFGFLKSSKQRSIPRRFLNEGEITLGLKYLLANLYNVFIGDVRSDIFNYRFGQYKDKKEEDLLSKQGGFFGGFKFFLQPHWLLAILFVIVMTIISWLVIFLFLAPRLIARKISSLF